MVSDRYKKKDIPKLLEMGSKINGYPYLSSDPTYTTLYLLSHQHCL